MALVAYRACVVYPHRFPFSICPSSVSQKYSGPSSNYGLSHISLPIIKTKPFFVCTIFWNSHWFADMLRFHNMTTYYDDTANTDQHCDWWSLEGLLYLEPTLVHLTCSLGQLSASFCWVSRSQSNIRFFKSNAGWILSQPYINPQLRQEYLLSKEAVNLCLRSIHSYFTAVNRADIIHISRTIPKISPLSYFRNHSSASEEKFICHDILNLLLMRKWPWKPLKAQIKPKVLVFRYPLDQHILLKRFTPDSLQYL